MNILILSENYYHNVSGVPVVVKYLAEGLVALGHNVDIATSNFKECPKEEVIEGVCVHRFNIYKDHLDRNKGDINTYLDFVLNFKADAIVFECLQCATTDIILPHLEKLKARRILHSHGISGVRLKPFEKKKDLVHTIANTYHWAYYKRYYRSFMPSRIKLFDCVISLSEVDDTIAYCKQHGVETLILGNAVEDVFLEPTGKVEQPDIVALQKPYFVSVAYYNQIKGQINILEEYYKTGFHDHAMVFIGPSKNEYYNSLLDANSKWERQYGKRDVLFLTAVDRHLIPNIIGNAKLYLVGSTIEQFSIAMVETMAKGVPFVSTNVGNACLLPGGVVVSDISSMHKAITDIIKDENMYSNLSQKGVEYVKENCVRKQVIKKMESIIQSVI